MPAQKRSHSLASPNGFGRIGNAIWEVMWHCLPQIELGRNLSIFELFIHSHHAALSVGPPMAAPK